MERIDLHTHSTFSDGSCTPTEILQAAGELGLTAVAITDHDNVGGIGEAMRAGEQMGIEVISGVEFGSGYRGRSIHMLGYLFDPEDELLNETIDWVIKEREKRNRKIAEKMRQDGIQVSEEQLREEHGTTSIGRPHFAEVLVKQNRANSIRDAFQKYLNPGEVYYFPRTFLPLDRTAEVIRQAGGVPVLAHPFQYRFSDQERREWMEYCRLIGVEGLECRYSGYGELQTRYLDTMAERLGFCRTGGSDFHGAYKPEIALGTGRGSLEVPREFLDDLKNRWEEIKK